MSDDHISRPEFDMFMKTTSEAAKQTATAITNLTEYTIRHDSEHQEVNRRLTDQGETLHTVKEAVLAQQSVADFWKTVGKYGKYSLIGGLTLVGAYLTKLWLHIP